MPRCPECHRRVPAAGVCQFDGTPISASAVTWGEAPELSGLSLERAVAAGGFATVWRAVDSAKRTVALKVGRGASVELQQRFRREAANLQKVGPPTAPRLHDQGQLADGRPFLVLEWLSAPTLASWLEQRTRLLPFEQLDRLAQALVTCIERVLAARVLHRDIKPENLVIFEDERTSAALSPRIVALDFGSAHGTSEWLAPRAPQLEAADTTAAGLLVGTSDYLAPERIQGELGDEAAEIYTLGVILYELATLRLPFASRGRAVLHDQLTLVPPLPSHSADVPAAWDRLLLDCLAKDPARRPATVAEVGARLVQCSHLPRSSAGVTAEPARPEAPLESAQLAAILLLEGARQPIPVAAVVGSFHGFLARTRSQRAIAVFPAADSGAPLDAALDAVFELSARRLVSAVRLHVSPVELRRGPDGAPTARGVAVDRPESWFSAASSDAAAFVSPAAAQALGEARLQRLFSSLGHGGAELASALPSAEHSAIPPLLGREAQLGALDASLRAWQQARDSVVLLLLGSRGTGKSRMARETIQRIRSHGGAHAVLLGGHPGRKLVSAQELWDALVLAFGPAPNSALPAPGLSANLRALAAREPLALVIDDAEFAEDALLDAIETALLESPALPLWVACVAEPRFTSMRPLWGTRIENFRKLELDALSPDAAQGLAAELLRPAEYIPEEALRQVARAATQLPGPLTELVSHIRRAGLIKRRPSEGAYFLDTAELAAIPAPATWHWLAARELNALEPSLAAGAKLAAVLGSGVSRPELEAVQQGLQEAATPLGAMDSKVLLERLVQSGLLQASAEGGDEYAFRIPPLAQALASLVATPVREHIQRLALEYHETANRGAQSRLPQIARHAAALGRRSTASAAQRKLAELAAADQRVVDAETHYGAALGLCDEPLERSQLLVGRARVYCRMYRLDESLSDLREAIELAERHDDWQLSALARFELATVLDWSGDYTASTEAARAAVELEAKRLGSTRSARALVALGRAAWRSGDAAAAIPLLSEGAVTAEAKAAIELAIIARLLLGCALVQTGLRAEAVTCFEKVVSDAEVSKDGLHLCAALGNRAFLWVVEGEVARCVEDLTRAVAVARRLGHPGTERTALVNLSEVLYWAARADEASVWLKQARLLEERFVQRPLHSAVLLEARIALVRDDLDKTRAALAWLFERGLPDAAATTAVALQSALLHVLRARKAARELPPPPLDWHEIARLSAGFLDAERAELEHWRKLALHDGSSSFAQSLLDLAPTRAGFSR